MLIFGGEGGNKLGDLWAFRPALRRWSEVRPLGDAPSAGAARSAVWDSQGGQLLVYGGFSSSSESALWAFRPSTSRWEHIRPIGVAPSPQGYHSAVWDPQAERMLVFGGVGPSFGLINDLWAYTRAQNTWSRLDPDGFPPPPILLHSAVWDPARSQMLVFGGVDPIVGGPTDELWTYSSPTNRWQRITPDSPKPPARLSASAVWDPIGQRLLVIAGSCGGGCYLNDVWSYSPVDNRWIELPSVGQRPNDRAGHSAVWDAAQNLVVIFGGSTVSDFHNDVWTYRPATYRWEHLGSAEAGRELQARPLSVWESSTQQLIEFAPITGHLRRYRADLGTWSDPTPNQARPGPRQEPTLVWDEVGHRALMFGGHWEGRFLAELWELEPATGTWRLLAPATAPPPRFRHSAAWDASNRRLYIFGGADARGDRNDLWRYDAASNQWLEIDAAGARPAARSSHSAAWDPLGRRMLMFGGLHGDVLKDFWSFDVASGRWEPLPTPGPDIPGRFGHSAVWDGANGRMLLLGGVGGRATTEEILSYRADTGWQRVTPRIPSGGRPGTTSWDPTRGRLWATFTNPNGEPSEVWNYDLGAGSWHQRFFIPARPSGRTEHSFVWDDLRREGWLFGGSRGSASLLGDLWKYEAGSDSWAHVDGLEQQPGARTEHAAAWDAMGRRMFVFGGRGANGPLADLWVFEAPLGPWRLLQPGGRTPDPRAESSAVWDEQSDRLLLYGGARDGRALSELWSYDPASNTWTAVDPGVGPLGRYRHGANWDSRSRRMLVFGGYGGAFPGDYLNDVWAFSTTDETWTPLSSEGLSPRARARASTTWDEAGQRLLVFGGFAGGIDYLLDLWAFDAATMMWTELDSREGDPRAGHRAVWDSVARRMLISGGQASGFYAEMAIYHE